MTFNVHNSELTDDALRYLYLVENLTRTEIADLLHKNRKTINRWLKSINAYKTAQMKMKF